MNLRITVTDRSGHVVKDLRQDDFILYEGSTPEKIVSFFKGEIAINYGLLIDHSGSMRTQINESVQAAKAIVKAQTPGDEAFIARLIADEGTIAVDWTSDKESLLKALDTFNEAKGGVPLTDALRWCGDYLATRKNAANAHPRRLVLILVSDGVDRGSHNKLEQVLKYLRGEGIQVFAINLYQDPPPSTAPRGRNAEHRLADRRLEAEYFLRTVTEETGGRTYVANAAKDVVEYQRFQYIVGYRPSQDVTNKGERKVRVKLVDAPGRNRYAITARVLAN